MYIEMISVSNLNRERNMKDKVSNRYVKQILFVLLTVSLCKVSFADNKMDKTMNSEQAKALNTITSMTAAFHQKDMAGVMASYENGGAVMFEPGNAIRDPEVIQQMFAGFFQINPNFTYPKGHEVYIANDIALHIAPWVMTGKAPDDTEISKNGLSVAVLRKQANGDWLMVLDNPNGQALLEQ
jgi:ketosteroid isomerase-like protein